MFIKNGMITSIVFVILGFVLALWPGQSLEFMCSVLGWGMLISGLAGLITCALSKGDLGKVKPVSGSLVLALLGLLLLMNTRAVVSVIPVIIGLVITANGVVNVMQTVQMKKLGIVGGNGRKASLVFAVLTMLLGILILVNPFGVAAVTIRIVGITLIYNGITNLWVFSRF